MADPTTVSELIGWFERNFVCCVGPDLAYFEIPLGPPDPSGYCQVHRMIYRSWVAGCRDVVGGERELVTVMFDDFKVVPREYERTMLFWRFPGKIMLTEESRQVYGKSLFTQELVEDGLATVPPGAVLNPTTSVWHEDGGAERIRLLRTRLCIPAMEFSQHTPLFFKAEGAQAVMIGG